MTRTKTRRRYGSIYALILAFAGSVESFTADCLTPTLTRSQAVTNCIALARKGRLRVVRRGTCGRQGKATVYRLGSKAK